MYLRQWNVNVLLLACSIGISCSGKIYPECVGAGKNGTFVASKSSCAKYIFCDGVNSFEGECLDDNLFNEEAGNCDDPSAVSCGVAGSGSENGALDLGEGIRNNSIIGGSGFVDHNLSWSPWNQPSEGIDNPDPAVVLSGPQCPMVFGLSNMIYLANSASCSSYYACYNGLAIPMICPRHMYFSTDSSKCERQEHVHCPLDRPVRLICHKGVYDFLPHPRNCEYYYFCSNGYLMIFQCPFQFTWHYERRACVHRSQAKCFSNSVLLEMIG